jgi:hypothetical protein
MELEVNNMYIRKGVDIINTVEMNSLEYQVFKKVFSTLIFNSEGVSNQFQVSSEEADIIRKMGAFMHVIR